MDMNLPAVAAEEGDQESFDRLAAAKRQIESNKLRGYFPSGLALSPLFETTHLPARPPFFW